MTSQLQDSFVEDRVGVDVDMLGIVTLLWHFYFSFMYLRHRQLRGCADARLLAQVQEGLHAAGAVVTLGVHRGDVVVACLEDEVHHDASLGKITNKYFIWIKSFLDAW